MDGIGQDALASVDVSSEGEETGLRVQEEDVLSEEDGLSPGGYQVEQGTLNLSPVNKSFVIMAEYIPSWLVMLSGKTSLKDIFVFVENEDLSLRRSLDLQDKFAVTPFIEEFIQWPWVESNHPKDVIVLVQGSSKFVSKCLLTISDRVSDMGCSVIAVSTGSRMRGPHSIPGLRWQKISHDQVGGVTNGIYQIGATPPFHRPAPMSSCKRYIKDIMKVDVGGADSAAPKDPLFRIHPRSLLQFVSAPSVFSKISGWVKRKLSRKEVAAAMDIPVSVIPAIEKSPDDDCLNKITSVPPLKVVQSAFGLITSKLGGDKKTRSPSELIGDTATATNISLAGGGIKGIQAAEISKSNAKAVKSDDAATDEDFWNWGAVTPPVDDSADPSAFKLLTGVYDPATHGPIFGFLRERMARQFSQNVTASARRYLQQTYSEDELKAGNSADGELKEDLIGMKDALKRVRGASFWDWSAGSFPFFWRWQPEVKKDMRDGTKLFVKGQLPATTQGQSLPRDKSIAEKIISKVNKVRHRGYIAVGRVLSLTSYFHVPKGESYIRIVYDLTKSGLNDALWAPTFWMPTVLNVLDCATHSSWFGDVDAGEMFLNYPLDKDMRQYAGVDVSWSKKTQFDCGPRESRWERWTRMAMGMLPSPWVTTRLFAWAMEIIKGDRTEVLNPFHWSRVVLNCPGDPTYDPTMPRVYKWNDRLKAIAGDCKTFVDDLRSVGATKEMCRAVTHRVETMMGYLGLQDATRKRRPDSQAPGEWTGTITRAIEGVGLFVTVSQTKWDRARKILAEIYDQFDDDESLPELDLKDLEKKVGFLVHLAMAYPLMFPFLKGFYLTMNSWRPMRDDNGWKMSKRAHDAFVEASGKKVDASEYDYFADQNSEAPSRVTACALLRDHITTLMELFESETPSLRLIRGSLIYQVLYVFGDASGAGFGSSWNDGLQAAIKYRFGVWAEEGQDTSSNYRECRNLVETLEDMGSQGDLEGREIFLFTDNMVSESIASKGSSKQSTLYDLVVRLYKLEMVFCCKITFVHVAGTRMIKQGTDGLSRGDLVEGVMRGEAMLSFIPLHRNCIERSPILKTQLEECVKGFGNKVELLEPEGWFERGHDFLGGRKNCDGIWMPCYRPGTFIWAPPPGAARHAIEELRQARQKRQKSFHVFVCPRLLYDEWRRHLYKSADMIIFLPAGKCDSWSADMHETLVLAFFFPYLPRDPWEFRKSRLMVGLEKQMCRLFKNDPADGWNLLSEFCVLAGRMPTLPVQHLQQLLSGQSRFTVSNQ